MQLLEDQLDKLVQKIVKACEFLTIAIGGWLAIALIANVFFRFVLNSSLTWVDESSALLLVCLMLAVAPIGFHEYIHISVDILLARLSHLLKSILLIFINACSILLFSITGYFGFFMVLDDFQTQMASIPIMQGWFTFFLPIASVFVILVCTNNIVRILRKQDFPKKMRDTQ